MNLNYRKSFNNNLPDVLILCGGQGARLRSVISDNPKPLAEVGKGVFLDILLQMIFAQGFTRAILAVGYMKEKIIERYSGDPRILFSIEESPLGTGGAVMNALDLVQTEYFIVMNGDSYCDADLKKIYEEHIKRKPLISMVLAKIDDISDSGSALIDENNRIRAFKEKIPEKREGLVNAGIYIFNKNIQNYKPQQKNFSLEHDLFPNIIGQFCHGYIISGGFFDIGVPERYNLVKKKFAEKNL